MLIEYYPILLDEKGYPRSMSLFGFLASDDFAQLQPYAVQEAKEKQERRFIIRNGNRFVLCDERERKLKYFQNASVIARYSKNGKEKLL